MTTWGLLENLETVAVETLLVSSLTHPALASQSPSHIQFFLAFLSLGDVSHQNMETSSGVEEMGKNSMCP